LTSQLPVDKCD